MATDIYQAALGIPPGNRPPNYYELLGLPLFCGEPPVIAEAVETAKAKLKPFLASGQAMEANRLLSEIEQARKTLLTAATRKAYEQQLRPAASPAALPQAATIPSAMPMTAQAVPAAPPMAMPAQSVPVQAAPVQVAPAQALPAQAVPMQAMPVQGVPVQAMPVQAVAAPMSGIPMATVAAPSAVSMPTIAPPAASPLGGSFNANSANATKINYQRKRRQRNALVFQLIGGAVVLLVGVLIFANWDKLKPKPVYATKQATQVASTPEIDPFQRPDLSRLNPTKPKSTADDSATSNPTKAVSAETLAEINKKLDQAKVNFEMPTVRTIDDPTGEKMTKTTPPPATPETKTPEPPKTKEPTKASPKEAAEIKKQIEAARAALRQQNFEKALESLDLASLEAFADESNTAIERFRSVVEANQKFWESVVAGAKMLQPLEELKSGDMVVGNVVEVDDKKATIKVEGKNEFVVFATPQKALPALAIKMVEKALGAGSEAANVAIGAYHLVDVKGDKEQARMLLQAAGAAGAPLLAELDAQ